MANPGVNHGLPVAAGASCTIVFQPIATGTRTATLTVLDNNFNSTQTANLTGTSVSGPTPLSVDTTGLSCTAGAGESSVHG